MRVGGTLVWLILLGSSRIWQALFGGGPFAFRTAADVESGWVKLPPMATDLANHVQQESSLDRALRPEPAGAWASAVLLRWSRWFARPTAERPNELTKEIPDEIYTLW